MRHFPALLQGNSGPATPEGHSHQDANRGATLGTDTLLRSGNLVPRTRIPLPIENAVSIRLLAPPMAEALLPTTRGPLLPVQGLGQTGLLDVPTFPRALATLAPAIAI